MLKNFGRLALASLFVTTFAGSALAQDEFGEDEFGEEPDAPAADEWSDDTSTTEATADSGSAAASGGGAAEHTMAISTELIALLDLSDLAGTPTFPTADILYGLDAETWLNLSVGLNFNKTADGVDAMGMPVEGESTFGLELGVGYRMYQDTEGKIRPYLEPGGRIAIDDFGEAGDVLALGLGGVMGVDYALYEQFTLGAAVGAELNFTEGFDVIAFDLFTTDINATFWW